VVHGVTVHLFSFTEGRCEDKLLLNEWWRNFLTLIWHSTLEHKFDLLLSLPIFTFHTSELYTQVSMYTSIQSDFRYMRIKNKLRTMTFHYYPIFRRQETPSISNNNFLTVTEPKHTSQRCPVKKWRWNKTSQILDMNQQSQIKIPCKLKY